MITDDEEFAQIRVKYHDLINKFHSLFVTVSLIELNLNRQDADLRKHDIAIKKLEKFMYLLIGVSISAHFVVELFFRLVLK